MAASVASARWDGGTWRNHGRRVGAVLWILTSWCVLGGWSFTTNDIRRPLIMDPEVLPRTVEEARPLTPSSLRRKNVEDSLAITRKAIDYFDVCKYEEDFNIYMLRDLDRAVELFPDNAFAWHQLGAYLALLNQTQAAIEATQRSLALLSGIPTEGKGSFAELRVVGLLNIAGFQLSEGEYDEALEAMLKIGDPESLGPFHRLAYYWTSARVLSALGSPDAARTVLSQARALKLEMKEVSSKLRVGYPQYFKEEIRTRSFHYIEGLIALDEGDTAKAVKELRASQQKRPRLFESSFALGNALYENGDTEAAIDELSRLEASLAEKPKMFFRRERIAYNLGNIFLEEGQLELAIQAYERSIRLVRMRARELQEDAGYYFPEETRVRELLASSLRADAAIFSEAYNNLGDAYFKRALETGQPGLLDRAETSFKEALENEKYRAPYVARTNLARLYWHRGAHDQALTEMALALGQKPNHDEALRGLFRQAAEAAPTDRELAAQAYSVLLDALARGPREQTAQSFAAELEAMRQTLEQENAGPESRRALGRLYLLRGDLAAARGLYEEAGTSFPQAAWPLVGLARLALDAPAPDHQEADRLLARAFGLPASGEGGAWAMPDRRDAFYLRGKIKTANGDFEGAQADFNKALEISPSWEPAALGLAYVQEQADAPTKA